MGARAAAKGATIGFRGSWALDCGGGAKINILREPVGQGVAENKKQKKKTQVGGGRPPARLTGAGRSWICTRAGNRRASSQLARHPRGGGGTSKRCGGCRAAGRRVVLPTFGICLGTSFGLVALGAGTCSRLPSGIGG